MTPLPPPPPGSPGAPAGTKSGPTPGEIVAIAGSAAVLIGSFLPFYGIGDGDGALDFSAWSNSFSLFPLAPLMVLCAVAVGAMIAATRFANVKLPESIAGFSQAQMFLCLSFAPMLVFLGFMVRSLEDTDKKIGGILLLLGSIAAYVGAVMIARTSTQAGEAS